MSNFLEKVNLNDFTLEALNTTEIEEISNWFPRGGVVDVNIAEQGMILSLHGQNICQEHIAKIDIWIGYKETEKNRAWLNAINRAKVAGSRTVKDKEWEAQADEEYIASCNELTLAKAAKKYFENKASNFSGWHYAFKTFLNRDYSLERLGNFQASGYNKDVESTLEHTPPGKEDWGGADDSDMWK